jgi:nitrate/TMAO reductase-like tetraheme cytochrome c subunit
MREDPRARRSLRGAATLRSGLAATAFALAAAPAGWLVTDALESRNDFCNACHLERPEIPLHIDVRRDFDRRPAASLAALHAAEAIGEVGRPFRCIDCHGGASFRGKLRVKALAAKDALVYLTGRFSEPTGMRHPLWDEDCVKCHEGFEEGDDRAAQARFHALPVHNHELGVDCVECHLAHESGGDAGAYFLHAAHVRSQCARCHSDFEEGR